VSAGPLILPYRGRFPRLAPSAFVAPGAALIGDVELGEEATVWFNCALRGDVAAIRVGARSNIQDGTILHTSSGEGGATIIGAGVTVGHQCLLHACTLEDACLIGMGAIVMDHAHVESGGWVGAGAMVTEGKRVKAGELWLGRPAKLARALTNEERERIAGLALRYIERGREYRDALGYERTAT
jgi:carbonic anhydrase/acetyltransferase-like protein (isoleucine patch superfamily)